MAQQIDGIAITTPLRTAFDCARWLTLVESVVAADHLAHLGLVSAEDLDPYAAAHRGLRGVRRVDDVLGLIEPLTESPMETRVRRVIVLAGLPRPTAQVVIVDAHGRFVARADFGYPEQRLIVEYDGALYWEQRRSDDRRREAIARTGLDRSGRERDGPLPGAWVDRRQGAARTRRLRCVTGSPHREVDVERA